MYSLIWRKKARRFLPRKSYGGYREEREKWRKIRAERKLWNAGQYGC